jgi:hypothetical protein
MGLPWFRVDTNLPTHDKILALIEASPKGKAAAFVYVCSLAYATGHTTDGFIRRAALPFIHATPTEARLLAESRLWEVVEGGWQIRNFLERNRSAETDKVISSARAAAGAKGAQKRWQPDSKKDS